MESLEKVNKFFQGFYTKVGAIVRENKCKLTKLITQKTM